MKRELQGRYVTISAVGEKAQAFKPAPLPQRPPIDWTPELHNKFRPGTAGARGGKADPGNYRSIQNYVAISSTGEVIYTPPSAVEVSIMMPEMVKWLNSELDIHPVLVSGIAQFQLVHIHPGLRLYPVWLAPGLWYIAESPILERLGSCSPSPV